MTERSCKQEVIDYSNAEGGVAGEMEVLVIMTGGQPVEFNKRVLKREVASGMPRGLGYHVALCQRDQRGQITGILDPSFRKPKMVAREEQYLEELFGPRKEMEEVSLRMMVMPLGDFEMAVKEKRFDPYELQKRYDSRMVMI